MSLLKSPLTPAQKKSLIAVSIAAAIGLSFIGGMALNRVLDDEYRTPIMLEKLYADAQEDLIQRATAAFRDDDLTKLAFISGLRQVGVAEAYNEEIRTLRANAFEGSWETKDVAAIQAIDTRMADRLLFDAMPKLGDLELFQVLRANSGLFLTESRAAMLGDTDSTDNDTRYYHLHDSHSTLSEQERDELTVCYNKLHEKLNKLDGKVLKYDMGSGTCTEVEPKKVSLFSPRGFLKYK